MRKFLNWTSSPKSNESSETPAKKVKTSAVEEARNDGISIVCYYSSCGRRLNIELLTLSVAFYIFCFPRACNDHFFEFSTREMLKTKNSWKP